MGSRKSHIALEFAYTVQHASPGTKVFWVYTSNNARFREGYHANRRELAAPSKRRPNCRRDQIGQRLATGRGERPMANSLRRRQQRRGFQFPSCWTRDHNAVSTSRSERENLHGESKCTNAGPTNESQRNCAHYFSPYVCG